MTGRTLVPRALVVLGTLFAAVGLLAVYVRMTALDDGEARSLARQLISRPDLRAQIAATSVDQLYANVDVPGLLRSRLPSAERGVAGPIAASLRGVAQQGVDSLLEQPAVQALWTNAVDRTHRQVVAIVENKSPVVGASNGDAVLDLRPLVLRAGERVGIGAGLARHLPPVAGRITILRSDDLRSAQRAIRVLNWVADWFWLLAIGSWAAAIWVSRAAPRRVLRGIGLGLVLTGLALLALRSLAGHYVVHSLVSSQSARPAASTAWSVVTARLADSAWTTLGIGVVVLVGLWLQSGRRAHAARYALAPLLRSADVAFGLLAALLLLLFWWGPTIETREWRGIALIVAGSAVAYELLRRRTAREFPDAGLGEAWASLRKRFASPVRELEPPADEVDRLERLTRLHESGALSAEEFEAAKRKLLGTGPRARDRSPG